jgi:hypothetical protein
MGQECAEVIFIRGERKTFKEVPQIPVGFQPIGLGGLDQGVDGGA